VAVQINSVLQKNSYNPEPFSTVSI
jgi:hypothetical protein